MSHVSDRSIQHVFCRFTRLVSAPKNDDPGIPSRQGVGPFEAPGMGSAKNLTGEYLLMWRFPKMGDPQVTIGFNTEIVLFWMIWEYPHFRKPPCITIPDSLL